MSGTHDKPAEQTTSWGRGMFIAGAAAGQARGTPKAAPWPIRCTCGELIADEKALREHSATCEKFQLSDEQTTEKILLQDSFMLPRPAVRFAEGKWLTSK